MVKRAKLELRRAFSTTGLCWKRLEHWLVKLFGIGTWRRRKKGVAAWRGLGGVAAAGRKLPERRSPAQRAGFVPLKSADNYLVKCSHDNSLIIAIQTALSRLWRNMISARSHSIISRLCTDYHHCSTSHAHSQTRSLTYEPFCKKTDYCSLRHHIHLYPPIPSKLALIIY